MKKNPINDAQKNALKLLRLLKREDHTYRVYAIFIIIAFGLLFLFKTLSSSSKKDALSDLHRCNKFSEEARITLLNNNELGLHLKNRLKKCNIDLSSLKKQ